MSKCMSMHGLCYFFVFSFFSFWSVNSTVGLLVKPLLSIYEKPRIRNPLLSFRSCRLWPPLDTLRFLLTVRRGEAVSVLQPLCRDSQGLFPPLCLFPLFAVISAHYLCPDVSQLVSGLFSLQTGISAISLMPPRDDWLSVCFQ